MRAHWLEFEDEAFEFDPAIGSACWEDFKKMRYGIRKVFVREKSSRSFVYSSKHSEIL